MAEYRIYGRVSLLKRPDSGNPAKANIRSNLSANILPIKSKMQIFLPVIWSTYSRPNTPDISSFSEHQPLNYLSTLKTYIALLAHYSSYISSLLNYLQPSTKKHRTSLYSELKGCCFN